MLIAIEAPIAHVLLALWNGKAALVATVLSIYGFLWLLGEYRATLLRPVSFDDDNLYIRYGLLGNEQVPPGNIAEVALCRHAYRRRSGLLRRVPACGTANILIRLHPGTRIATVFGEREYSAVALAVDEPDRFVQGLSARRPDCAAGAPARLR